MGSGASVWPSVPIQRWCRCRVPESGCGLHGLARQGTRTEDRLPVFLYLTLQAAVIEKSAATGRWVTHIWTVLQHVGPNHLGLWLRAGGSRRRSLESRGGRWLCCLPCQPSHQPFLRRRHLPDNSGPFVILSSTRHGPSKADAWLIILPAGRDNLRSLVLTRPGPGYWLAGDRHDRHGGRTAGGRAAVARADLDCPSTCWP